MASSPSAKKPASPGDPKSSSPGRVIRSPPKSGVTTPKSAATSPKQPASPKHHGSHGARSPTVEKAPKTADHDDPHHVNLSKKPKKHPEKGKGLPSKIPRSSSKPSGASSKGGEDEAGASPSPPASAGLSSALPPPFSFDDLPLPTHNEPSAPPPKSNAFRYLLVLVGAVALMGLLFLVSHFVLFKSKQPAPAAVCTSPDCEKDAVFVAEHINRSADPCHDFEAFACSMWSKAGEVYGYGEGIMRLQIAAWFSGFEAVLNEALDSIEPVNRLKKMYDLCMTTDVDTTTVQNSIKELKQFMRERGLGWPHLPAKKERPLGVLLDLAYHWRLGLWFDASDLRPASAASGMRVGPRVLLIEPGAFVGAWAAQHYSVLNQSYTAYWRALERQFRDSEDDPPRTDNIEEITKRETEILNALLKVMLSNTRKPAEFPVGDIERFTPNISEAVWSEELNKKVVSLEITTLTNQSFDNITVTDTAILYTLNNLLTTYNQKEVLDHLSWFFVQVFASLADRGNLIYKFGNKVLADARRHLYCATEVEASNQFLIAAIHTRLRIPIGARKTFDEQLQTIKQAALDNIALHSTWADGDSRKKVADKVRKEKTAIWPPDELLETSVLKEMYADISLSRSTFIEYWFDAYRRIRTLLGDPRYAEAMAMARNFVLPYFDYDYISNHVRLALGTVAAPLYRAGSTYAMLYGGIGFSYAAQLVRAFDEGGLTISPDGRINASWVPAAWHTGHAKKSKCTSPLSPFPEIPALQISHAAFQRAVANLSEPPKPLMLDYSEEQVFFIAACFTLCDVEKNRYGTYSGRCNKMVQNVPAFAAAFSCLDGSKMKPARPCPYFD